MKPSIFWLTGFLVLLISSCSTADAKADLIGIWESTGHPANRTVLTFYKDSVITEGFMGGFKTSASWSVDSTDIIFKNVRIHSPFTKLDSTLKERMVYKYKLNKSNNSLELKYASVDSVVTVGFVQIDKNPFDSTSPFNK